MAVCLMARAEYKDGIEKEKTMKVSKKLITSLACLLLSVVVCVWACYAWFSLNGNVDAGNINTSVIDGGNDIVSIEVTTYYLEEVESSSSTAIYKQVAPMGSGDMYEYGNTDNYCTAILLQVQYEINPSTEKKFAMGASTINSTSEVQTTIGNGGKISYSSHLSNVVSFTEAKLNEGDGTFSPSGNTYNYLNKADNGDYVKSSQIYIIEDIGGASGKQTKYLIVDYNADLFGNIFSLVLANGGNISSKVTFDGDITITLSGE
jgi:hypothetical protein